LVTLDSQWIGVHLVFGPMVQKLLNINFIIENSMKSKPKVWGNWGMFLLLLGIPQWLIG
jgi:hypothetical protein